VFPGLCSTGRSKEIIAEWLAQSTWRHRKTRSRHEGRADDRTLALEDLGEKVVYRG
jgi:hypothetical protein